MLTVNLSHRLVNGSMGIVTDMTDDGCTVDFADAGRSVIKPYTFTVFSQETSQTVASRTQIPLQLCYAITIHKAQGMTLDSVVIDAQHATNPGQLATALGRAVNSQNVQLKNLDINIIPKQPQPVTDFYTNNQNTRDTLADHSCCRAVPYIAPDVVVEHPLGEEPLVVQPDPQNDVDESIMADWEMDLLMSQLSSNTTATETVDSDTQEFSQLPPTFNMNDFRACVSRTFSGMETENQKTMNQKDTAVTNVKLSVYFGHLWVKLKDMATSFIPKSKTVQNKDFGKLITNFDQYCMSQEHTQHLMSLFARIPDDVDMQLSFKYRSLLLKKFLSTFTRSESDTDDVDISEPHQRTPSHASNAGVRYLGGMCIAKTMHKQRQLALNNIHNSKERVRVSEYRQREKMLRNLVTPQHSIQQTTNEPESLQLIIRKQNARFGLTILLMKPITSLSY